jgi:hypothetical protein
MLRHYFLQWPLTQLFPAAELVYEHSSLSRVQDVYATNLFSLKLFSAEVAFSHTMNLHVSIVLNLLFESLSAAVPVTLVILKSKCSITKRYLGW